MYRKKIIVRLKCMCILKCAFESPLPAHVVWIIVCVISICFKMSFLLIMYAIMLYCSFIGTLSASLSRGRTSVYGALFVQGPVKWIWWQRYRNSRFRLRWCLFLYNVGGLTSSAELGVTLVNIETTLASSSSALNGVHTIVEGTLLQTWMWLLVLCVFFVDGDRHRELKIRYFWKVKMPIVGGWLIGKRKGAILV